VRAQAGTSGSRESTSPAAGTPTLSVSACRGLSPRLPSPVSPQSPPTLGAGADETIVGDDIRAAALPPHLLKEAQSNVAAPAALAGGDE
jgi:hypothetical protein